MISPNVNIYTIIVTYNGMRWADACFGSLRGSTVPLHTVVVDNGSTDGTPQRIAERFPEVHLIRSDENLGFGRGNNAGIRYALGQGATHFFLLNQDAWIYPDTVERLLGAEDDRSGILSPVHLDGSAERMDEAFKRYLFGDAAATRDDGLLLGGPPRAKRASSTPPHGSCRCGRSRRSADSIRYSTTTAKITTTASGYSTNRSRSASYRRPSSATTANRRPGRSATRGSDATC